MKFRLPRIPAVAALATATMIVPAARAQDAVQTELKSLRQLVELQSKQIEVLAAQIARLNSSLGQRAEPASTVAAQSPSVETADFVIPAARPVTAVPPANVHIVVKGESLDKIAKSHGTTAIDIQKLNRISDPKRLQIGQQLILPPSTPKKEGQ
jgi:LysM repeat protein